MTQDHSDRIEYPHRWAAAFYAVGVFLIVTTPTGSPAALLHLVSSAAALVGATWFTALHFERKGY